MEEQKRIMLESKVHALEELLTVSETSFLAEAQKLEQANKQLHDEINEHERLNKKLQESEEEFRALFESSRDAIMLLDQNTFFDCNKATLDLFGFSSKEQFVLRTPSDLSPPTQPDGEDSLTAALKQIEKAYRNGTNFFEWINTRQDGAPFQAEVLLSRLEYKGKTVLQSTVRDITKRKQAENALAGEELRRRILMGQSRDGIVVLTEDGKVFEANRQYADALGYTAAEALQLHIWDWDTQWTREQLLEMLRKVDAAGSLLETRHRRKDGSLYDVEVSSNGAVIEGRKLIFCVCRDITERKRAEEKIHHISAIQNLILENSTLGIALVRNRVFEWANARVGELLMLPLEQIQGAPTRVIYPSDESYEEMGKISYPVLARGERSVNTCQLKRGDESLFWCRFIGKALNPAKIHDGSVWMFEDITEEKLARKLVEDCAQQQGRIEMANNMLHDIGNALTGISSCMTGPQLEKDWPEIKLLRQLSVLFASASKELAALLGEAKEKALTGLIDALTSSLQKRNTNNLDFCEKISNAVGHVCAVLDLQRYYLKEKSTPLATVFDIKKIVEDALTILSSSLQKRNIEVKISTSGIKTIVCGDQTRIMRLFLNIIKNIYEAFDDLEPSPGRKLEINIISDIEKRETAIVFKDNGIGFSPETGGKLFERGFTTKRTGSGIGLHECLAIVESHGGTITLESNGENAGACTIIKLPFPGNQKG
ncbi:MAG: PAS domain-containing sensor histidine kinase [Victivallaceae bacterium]